MHNIIVITNNYNQCCKEYILKVFKIHGTKTQKKRKYPNKKQVKRYR